MPGPSVGEAIRRVLNIAGALALLALAAPLMLVIAAAIKLTSRGPVLYTQPRVGLDRRRDGFDRRGSARSVDSQGRRGDDSGGRLFTIYKFRTMRIDQGIKPQVWAQPNDPRVTGVGRILRRYRLDELPQLFNILRGDMNLVGPRPEQPDIFVELRDEIERYARRQKVLPGITGWAQVNQEYDQCLEDVRRKVSLDLEYIERRSPWKDLMIMLKTVPVMIFRKGSL